MRGSRESRLTYRLGSGRWGERPVAAILFTEELRRCPAQDCFAH